MSNSRNAMVVLFGLAAAACGGGGGGGGSEGIITFDSLSKAEQQNFEAWKLQPIKSCAWYEAFPTLAEEYPPPSGQEYEPSPRVDIAQLALAIGETPTNERARGLPVLQGAGGELVMFGQPAAEIGFEVTDRSTSHTVNGRPTVFEATSRWEDGLCVITLAGEELFRAPLASAVPLALGYDPETPAPAPAALGELREATGPDAEVIHALDAPPLLRSTLDALAPTERTQTFLAEHFDITLEEAKAFFPLGAPLRPGSVDLVAIDGAVPDGSTTPFAPDGAVFDVLGFAGDGYVQTLLQPGQAQLELFFLPGLGATDRLVRLVADVDITVAGDVASAQVSSIELGDARERTDEAAVDCFLAVDAASQLFVPIPGEPRSRNFTAVYGACEILSADRVGALASDPAAIQIVVREAGSLPPPSLGAYRGWDGALIEVVDSMLTRKIPLAQLDPGSAYPVSDQTTPLQSYLDAIDDPEARIALQRPLVSLVFDAYFADRLLTPTEQDELSAALARASGPFLDSTVQMVLDLNGSNPLDGHAAARCGAELTSDRLAQIEATIADAQSYAYGAAFAAGLRSEALQACYSPDDLVRIAGVLDDARAFSAKEAALTGGELFELHHERFVAHALQERWTADTYLAAADVIGFALVTQYAYCSSYSTLSEQAECFDGGASYQWLSTAPGYLLDPELAGRYPALAKELTARFEGQLADSDDFAVRFAIESAFFDSFGAGMWLYCGDEAFAANQAELLGLLDELDATTDFSERFDLEQEIDDLVNASCAVR
jgi:hypothetical protein